jgi:hypothetical protein
MLAPGNARSVIFRRPSSRLRLPLSAQSTTPPRGTLAEFRNKIPFSKFCAWNSHANKSCWSHWVWSSR